MKLIEIHTLKELNNIISKKSNVIVYYYSNKFDNITKKLNKLLENIYDLNVLYYSVNVENCDSIIKTQDITTYPVFHIFKKSEFIKEIFCNYYDMEEIVKLFYN